MALTRDFHETINKRVNQDHEFARALLDEATSLFLNGEPDTARLIFFCAFYILGTTFWLFLDQIVDSFLFHHQIKL